MSADANQILEMINMLPEQEQELAYELIKRIVLAWDSDYTRLTPEEKSRLALSEAEIAKGEILNHSDIEW
ncbi:MAG TPA: hypothetical protein VN374_06240 [Desulfitobacteriaceae bacterium]|nr:hypothetical protein [Desulfitobacteriaceae bacterium]